MPADAIREVTAPKVTPRVCEEALGTWWFPDITGQAGPVNTGTSLEVNWEELGGMRVSA
jgi:hypothetical protein